MRKVYLHTMMAFILAIALAACTKGYESQKTAGNFSVTLTANRYPLIIGDNSLGVKVSGSEGKAVTDAKVEARYYMPAMPGMAPMEYTTQAVLAGSAYSFGANIPMEGGWKVDVSITQPGGAPQTVTFNVDAR